MLRNPETLPSEYNDTTSPRCRKLLAENDDDTATAAAEDATAAADAAAIATEGWWPPPPLGGIIMLWFLFYSKLCSNYRWKLFTLGHSITYNCYGLYTLKKKRTNYL